MDNRFFSKLNSLKSRESIEFAETNFNNFENEIVFYKICRIIFLVILKMKITKNSSTDSVDSLHINKLYNVEMY